MYSIISLCCLFVGISCLGTPDTWSGWHNIAAYTTPQVDISHGLGEVPMKVEVQVKVSDPTLGDIIFTASGSAQRSLDPTQRYGGVIYMYNDQYVRVMAPGPHGCSSNCNGGIVYLGESGFNGPTPGAASGFYISGQVRVRAWKMCTYDKPKLIWPLIYLDTALGYQNVFLSARYDVIFVKVNLKHGWITDAQGMVSFNVSHASMTGVVYGTDGVNVIIRVPRENTLGSLYSTANWGSGTDTMTLSNATIRIFGWKYKTGTPIKVTKTVLVYPSSNENHFIAVDYNPTLRDVFLTVEANANDLFGDDIWSFPIAGSAPTNGQDSSVGYGSVFYGYNNTTIMLWTPSRQHGCGLQISPSWGEGTKSFCSRAPAVTIKYYLTNIENLPCEEKGCSGREAGPFCDCVGSGFEGQFCSAPVACPTLVAGVDYINSSYVWEDTNNDGEINFQDGSSFTCMTGHYNTSGDYVRFCTANKTWSGEPYTCSPVPCNIAPEPALFGAINGSYQSHFGSVVRYVCNDGYDWSSGDMTRSCDADGTWNGTAPVCEKSCGEPDPPTGAVRTNVGITEGVMAEYQCEKGHEYVSGDLKRACLVGGTWNGTAPVCQHYQTCMSVHPTRVSWGTPLSGTESSLSVSGTLYSDTASYTCTLGYEDSDNAGQLIPVTGKDIHCLVTKTWSGGPLNCIIIKCTLPTSSSAQITAHRVTPVSEIQVEYGANATYECITGYRLSTGSLVLTCLASREWSDVYPVCEITTCIVPQNTSNATTVITGLSYLSLVMVVCDPNFFIYSGNPKRYCNADGEWEGEAPVCMESCGEPDPPTGAVRTNVGITEGVLAEYQCEKGHEYVSGDLKRACLVGGTWNGTAPVCQRHLLTSEFTLNDAHGGDAYTEFSIFSEPLYSKIDCAVSCSKNLWCNAVSFNMSGQMCHGYSIPGNEKSSNLSVTSSEIIHTMHKGDQLHVATTTILPVPIETENDTPRTYHKRRIKRLSGFGISCCCRFMLLNLLSDLLA